MHGKAWTPASNGQKQVSSNAFANLVDWMKGMLPRDKVRTAMGMIRHPLDTVGLVGEMYQELERAFDGVDRTENLQFSNDTLTDDWRAYRNDKLGGEDAWRSRGIDTMRCRINGIAVVDLKKEPNSSDSKPCPYFYVLDVSSADSFIVKDDNSLEYLIYYDSSVTNKDYKKAFVLDDSSYRIFRYFQKGKDSRIELEVDNPHNLEYCPARMFWTDAIDSSHPELKQHPLTNHLGGLDWVQILTWFGRFGDLFNGWPITTTFEQKCNYINESEYCDNGYLRLNQEGEGGGVFLMDGDSPMPCPVCKDRNSIGPGTNYRVPVPSPANGNARLLPAVGITQVDVAAIKYQEEKLDRAATKIFSGVVGSMFEAMNKQAVNKDQVASLFEARKKALIKVARNMEAVQAWVERSICRLRYGDSFVSLEVNYGSEFFLFSSDELYELYTKAKADSADAATLDNLQWLFYQTKHRRQPRELERAKIIMALDPARHMNATTALPLLESGVISREDYAIKLNMSTLVARFEREIGPLISFQKEKEWGVRINAIKGILLSYIPKKRKEESNQKQPVKQD